MTIDPKLADFMDGYGFVFECVENGRTVWRRMPIDMGDESDWTVTMPPLFAVDGYEKIMLSDAIRESAYQAGRASVISELKKTLAL